MTQTAPKSAQVIPLHREPVPLPALDLSGPRDRTNRRRFLAFLAASVALHLAAGLLWPRPEPLVVVEPQLLTVRLEEPPPLVPEMKEAPRPPEPAAVRPRPQPRVPPRPEPVPAPAPAAEEPPPAPPAVLTAPQGGGAPQVTVPSPEPPRPVPVTPPVYNAAYLSNPPPDYPVAARRRGQEGLVLLSVLVSEAGLPKEIRLAKSSGTSMLDDAALEAVKGWKFVPARQGEQVVAAWVEVPIRFRLEGR